MKVTGKICIVLIVLVGVAFSASHTYRQVVRSFPDTLGWWWYSYDVNNWDFPGDNLDKTSPGSGVLYSSAGQFMRWFADCANFPSGDDWVDGDEILMLGSYCAEHLTTAHTGYYFLYSDEMDATVDPQNWSPDDTLREMPKPMVSQVAPGDSVICEIENPFETNRPPWGSMTYDVMGFWVVLDTTGTGIESFFDVVLGYYPVNGGPGGSTFCTWFPGDVFATGGAYDTYHAYHIVARPETTTTPGVVPGWSTLHMSQNSDPLVVSGIAEYNNEVPATFSARPSVFTERTSFSVTLSEQQSVSIKLYDAAGQLVSTVCDEVMTAGSHTIDFNGAALPSGVYFYALQTDNKQLSGQIVKLQ